MFKKILNKLMGKDGAVLRGVDVHGIKYFSQITETGVERRWFQHPKGEMFPDNIPSEWYSWLRFRRDEAPTKELSETLEKIREQTKRNAKLWQEEMMRMEFRSDLTEQDASKDNFQAIVHKLRTEEEMTEEFIPEREIRTDSAADIRNDDFTAQEPPSVNSTVDLIQSSMPPRRRLAPRISVEKAYSAREKKAVDITNLSPEELRDTIRAYSLSRTSKFLGVKPQIRTEAKERLDQLTSEMEKKKENK